MRAAGVRGVEEAATEAERHEVVQGEGVGVLACFGAADLVGDVVAAEPAGESEGALSDAERPVPAAVAWVAGHGRPLWLLVLLGGLVDLVLQVVTGGFVELLGDGEDDVLVVVGGEVDAGVGHDAVCGVGACFTSG